MNGFKGRKTGLFKPVWLADSLDEPIYLLIVMEHLVLEMVFLLSLCRIGLTLIGALPHSQLGLALGKVGKKKVFIFLKMVIQF